MTRAELLRHVLSQALRKMHAGRQTTNTLVNNVNKDRRTALL
jgi:hypothetical protein